MATYKKRGGKPKTKPEHIEAIEEESTTAEVFSTLDEGASKTEEWFEKNQKYVIGFVGIIALVVLAYLAFIYFVQEPKEEEAMNEMYQAQTYFDEAITATESDSLYNLALNGGRGKLGFLDIVNDYGSTKAGNLANYYAGMAYLNMNDYKNAIQYLDNFSSDDLMLAPLAKGGIGDAFVQLNEQEKALGYYEEAASLNDNDFTTPRYALKAGIVAINLGKKDAAIKHFKNITENYPKSDQAANAKIYLAQAEAM